MNHEILTGKPSVDRPWLQYYPQVLLDNLQVPTCTLRQYLEFNMPSLDTVAMHYYGTDITWQEIFACTDACAKSLKTLGFGVGDQIPTFLGSVPEFLCLMLAAEKIGASLLCRDNTIEENVDAVAKSGTATIFAHTFLSEDDMNAYLNGSNTRKIVLLDPCNSCNREDMPDYIQASLDARFVGTPAHGPATMTWSEFLALGESYTGTVEAPVDIDRPLFRCYTSGSTGTSKQVIHSAHTTVGVLSQMNFYGAAEVRPKWLLTIFPPSLVSSVVSALLLPLASNKLLILDPWVSPFDIDLECMRYQPNGWPMVPMLIDILVNSKRIPDDYDLSHLHALGAGSEACNNTQLRRIRQFLDDHNCHVPFTTGYGSSEAGSNVTFHISGRPAGDANVGCPMPLTNVGIFKPGTIDNELGYNVPGEICISGPGVMLGYDNDEATAKALKVHADGKVWLHMGDIGHIDELGHIYTAGRGSNKRFGGGFLDILPMENMLADANIPGIQDQFFVNVPDAEHEGFLQPYLFVVLDADRTVDSIRDAVASALPTHMVPVEIIQLPERPYWHFKTNRIGLTNEILAARAATVSC